MKDRKKAIPPKGACHHCGKVTPLNQPVVRADNTPTWSCGADECTEDVYWEDND